MAKKREPGPSRLRMVVVTQGSLNCPPGEEKIAFEVRWQESVEATLVRVRDNLSIKAEMLDGTRVIAFEYCAEQATLHRIRWYLQSRQQITGLVASARRNGGEIQELDASDGPTQLWESDGVLA